MANRFTFDEIKQFKVGDEFWSRNNNYKVSTEPVINSVEFYGETHEKLEWDGYCDETQREVHFGVVDNTNPHGDDEMLIFKTSTSHNVEGQSPLKPRAHTETTGGSKVEYK